MKNEVPIFFHQNFYGISDVDSLKGFIVGVKKGDANETFLRFPLPTVLPL